MVYASRLRRCQNHPHRPVVVSEPATDAHRTQLVQISARTAWCSQQPCRTATVPTFDACSRLDACDVARRVLADFGIFIGTCCWVPAQWFCLSLRHLYWNVLLGTTECGAMV